MIYISSSLVRIRSVRTAFCAAAATSWPAAAPGSPRQRSFGSSPATAAWTAASRSCARPRSWTWARPKEIQRVSQCMQ